MLGRDEGSGAISRFAYKVIIWMGMTDTGRREKAYLPVFSCNTGEFTFKRFLADFSSVIKK